MEKVYYKRMRKALALPCAALLLFSSSSAQQQQQPAPMRTSALDSHEGVTIGAEPWTNSLNTSKLSQEEPLFLRCLAIRVMFRNETADSIRVNLSRIRLTLVLEDESRQELPSLTSEELADAVFRSKVKDPSPVPASPFPCLLPQNRPRQELD